MLVELDAVDVAWVADADVERAKMIGSAFGVPHVRAAPEVLPEADVVLVAVPYGVRDPYFSALHSRVKGFYVEKPFARTLAEHDARCSLLPPAGFACGFQRRSWGPVKDLRRLVEEAPFGKLRAMSTSFGGPGLKTGGRYSSSLALAGGGVLFEVGVHAIDCVVHVSNARAFTLERATMDLHHGFDVHTEAHGTLDVEGRAIPFDFVVSNLRETSMLTQLTFEHATVTFDLFGSGTIRVQPNGGGSWTLTRRGPATAATTFQAFAAHWRRYLEAMSTREPNEASAEASRVTTAIVEDVYKAAR